MLWEFFSQIPKGFWQLCHKVSWSKGSVLTCQTDLYMEKCCNIVYSLNTKRPNGNRTPAVGRELLFGQESNLKTKTTSSPLIMYTDLKTTFKKVCSILPLLRFSPEVYVTCKVLFILWAKVVQCCFPLYFLPRAMPFSWRAKNTISKLTPPCNNLYDMDANVFACY